MSDEVQVAAPDAGTAFAAGVAAERANNATAEAQEAAATAETAVAVAEAGTAVASQEAAQAHEAAEHATGAAYDAQAAVDALRADVDDKFSQVLAALETSRPASSGSSAPAPERKPDTAPQNDGQADKVTAGSPPATSDDAPKKRKKTRKDGFPTGWWGDDGDD